jgi:UDP-glucose 4-epimerase
MKPVVLLTGGFGNLGCRIAAELHRSGNWSIRLASRTLRPSPPWAPDAEIIKLDLSTSSEIENACSGVSAVIHLAALNDRDAYANPDLAELVSGTGTQLLVQSAARAGVGRILFMSTAQVYGSPLEGSISESSPTKSTHPYGTSHLSGELAVKQAHERGQILGVRLRCANGFGFPLDISANIWHALVPDLCKQSTTTGKMILNSSGIQQRNFIPIDDIVNAVIHFLDTAPAKIGDGLFNLGGPRTYSLLEIAKIIADRSQVVLGHTPDISHKAANPADKHELLDFKIDKLIASGFSPKNNINFEIDNLLQLCKDFVS